MQLSFHRRTDNAWILAERREVVKNALYVLGFGGAFFGGVVFLLVTLVQALSA